MPDKKKIKHINLPFLGILGVATIFLVWLILSYACKDLGFPSLSLTFEKFGKLFTEDRIYVDIGYTLLRLLIIFSICVLVSLILGIIGGLSKSFKKFFNPIVVAIRTIPTAAIIIVLILMFAPFQSMFAITFIIMFPILYESTASGIENIDPAVLMALRVDGGERNSRSIFQVIVPMASPYIFLGMVQSFGLGIKALIMAEVFVGDTRMKGLGFMLKHYYIDAQIETCLAIGIIAIILCSLIDIPLHFIKKKFKTN